MDLIKMTIHNNKYRVDKVIGKGGQATVFLA